MSVDIKAPERVGPHGTRAVLAALAGEPCQVTGLFARPHPVPIDVWRDAAQGSDLAVLAHCVGDTVDIGCGPGRMTHGLTGRGARVLGIDVEPAAVALTRRRGASAALVDVFGPVPSEGRWDTALLADGNIGIGGDPIRLLRRVRELLAPGGRAVVDVAPPGVAMRTRLLTLVCAGAKSAPFPWSLVGADDLGQLATAAGMTVRMHNHYQRWVAVLGKAT